MMELYAANLYSMDCIQSANIYSDTFQLKVVTSKINHSELVSENGFRIFFSSPSKECLPICGSITFVTKIQNLELPPQFFTLKDLVKNSFYQSYIDYYGNLIWLYYIA